MSSEIINSFKSAIDVAKLELVELDKMINILQATGEETTALRAKYMNTKAKIERYERAISGGS